MREASIDDNGYVPVAAVLESACLSAVLESVCQVSLDDYTNCAIYIVIVQQYMQYIQACIYIYTFCNTRG